MRRPWKIAILSGVASAVSSSPLLVAQDRKPAAPAAAAAVEVKKVAVGVKPAEKVEVKEQAVRKVVARRVMAPAVVEQQARQFLQQFRAAMRAEYYFLRNVCKPTADQRKALARAGEAALWDVAKEYAQVQMRPMQVRNGRAVYPDPRRMLEEAMAKAVVPLLTPEQAARYRAETEARAADRRRAIAENVVARMDQDLVLSPEQREKIVAAALAKWDDAWCQSLETLTYGDQFIPRLPDDVVVPHLDDRQKSVWRGSQNNQSFFFGFVGNLLPSQDVPGEDAELIEAQAEADQERQKGAPAPEGVFHIGPIAPAAPAAPAKPAEGKK